MLEKLVASYLTSYLGEYFENIDTEQVKLSLWSGSLQLQHLRVRKDALRKLDTPLCIVDGVIEKLVILVPFSRLKSESVVLRLSTVNVVVALKSSVGYDAEQSEAEALLRKQLDLEHFEQLLLSETETRRTANHAAPIPLGMTEEERQSSTFAERLKATIANNIKVELENVVVHFRSPALEQGSSCSSSTKRSLSLRLRSVRSSACDAAYNPAFSPVTQRILRQTLHIRGVSVCLEEEEQQQSRKPSAAPATDPGRSGIDHTTAITSPRCSVEDVVTPFDATVRLQYQPVVFQPEIPECLLAVQLQHFTGQLDEVHWAYFVTLYDSIIRQLETERYRQLRPRRSSPVADPMAWWQYAIGCVQMDLQRKRQRTQFSWARYQEMKRDRDRYARLYTRSRRTLFAATNWLDPLTPDEACEMRGLETKMPLETLKLARRMAVEHVEVEREAYADARAHARKASGAPLSSPRRRASDGDAPPTETRYTEERLDSSGGLSATHISAPVSSSPSSSPTAAPRRRWFGGWFGPRQTLSTVEDLGGEVPENRAEVQEMIQLLSSAKWTEAQRAAIAKEFGLSAEEAKDFATAPEVPPPPPPPPLSFASAPSSALTDGMAGDSTGKEGEWKEEDEDGPASAAAVDGGGSKAPVKWRVVVQLASTVLQLRNSKTGESFIQIYQRGFSIGAEVDVDGKIDGWATMQTFGARSGSERTAWVPILQVVPSSRSGAESPAVPGAVSSSALSTAVSEAEVGRTEQQALQLVLHSAEVDQPMVHAFRLLKRHAALVTELYKAPDSQSPAVPWRSKTLVLPLEVQARTDVAQHVVDFFLFTALQEAENAIAEDSAVAAAAAVASAVSRARRVDVAQSVDELAKEARRFPQIRLTPVEERDLHDAKSRLLSLVRKVEKTVLVDWQVRLVGVTVQITEVPDHQASRIQLSSIAVHNDPDREVLRRQRSRMVSVAPGASVSPSSPLSSSPSSPRFGEVEDDWMQYIHVGVGKFTVSCLYEVGTAASSGEPSKRKENTAPQGKGLAQWRNVVEPIALKALVKRGLFTRRQPDYPSLTVAVHAARPMRVSFSRSRLSVACTSLSLLTDFAQSVSRQLLFRVKGLEDQLGSRGAYGSGVHAHHHLFRVGVAAMDEAYVWENDHTGSAGASGESVDIRSVEVKPGLLVVCHQHRPTYAERLYELQRSHVHLVAREAVETGDSRATLYLDVYVEQGGTPQDSARHGVLEAKQLLARTLQCDPDGLRNATLTRARVEEYVRRPRTTAQAPSSMGATAPNGGEEEEKESLRRALETVERASHTSPCHHVRFVCHDEEERTALRAAIEGDCVSSCAALSPSPEEYAAFAATVPLALREQKQQRLSLQLPACEVELLEEEEGEHTRGDSEAVASHLLYLGSVRAEMVQFLHAKEMRFSLARCEVRAAVQGGEKTTAEPVLLMGPPRRDVEEIENGHHPAATPCCELETHIQRRPAPLPTEKRTVLRATGPFPFHVKVSTALLEVIEFLWDVTGIVTDAAIGQTLAPCTPWVPEDAFNPAQQEARWRADVNRGGMQLHRAEAHMEQFEVAVYYPSDRFELAREPCPVEVPVLTFSAQQCVIHAGQRRGGFSLQGACQRPTARLRHVTGVTMREADDATCSPPRPNDATAHSGEDTILAPASPTSSRVVHLSYHNDFAPPVISLSDFVRGGEGSTALEPTEEGFAFSPAAPSTPLGYRFNSGLRVELNGEAHYVYYHPQMMAMLELLTRGVAERATWIPFRTPFLYRSTTAFPAERARQVQRWPSIMRDVKPPRVFTWCLQRTEAVVADTTMWLPDGEWGGLPVLVNENTAGSVASTDAPLCSYVKRLTLTTALGHPGEVDGGELATMTPSGVQKEDVQLQARICLETTVMEATTTARGGEQQGGRRRGGEGEANAGGGGGVASSSAAAQVPSLVEEVTVMLTLQQPLFQVNPHAERRQVNHLRMTDLVVHSGVECGARMLLTMHANYLEWPWVPVFAPSATALRDPFLASAASLPTPPVFLSWYCELPRISVRISDRCSGCAHFVHLKEEAGYFGEGPLPPVDVSATGQASGGRAPPPPPPPSSSLTMEAAAALVVEKLYVEMHLGIGGSLRLRTSMEALSVSDVSPLPGSVGTSPMRTVPTDPSRAVVRLEPLPSAAAQRSAAAAAVHGTESALCVVYESSPSLDKNGTVDRRDTTLRVDAAHVIVSAVPRFLFTARDTLASLPITNALYGLLRMPPHVIPNVAQSPLTLPRSVVSSLPSPAPQRRQDLLAVQVEQLTLLLPDMICDGSGNVSITPLLFVDLDDMCYERKNAQNAVTGEVRSEQLFRIRAVGRNGFIDDAMSQHNVNHQTELAAFMSTIGRSDAQTALRPLLCLPIATTLSSSSSESALTGTALLDELFEFPTTHQQPQSRSFDIPVDVSSTTTTTAPTTVTAPSRVAPPSARRVEGGTTGSATPWVSLKATTTTSSSSASRWFGEVQEMWLILPPRSTSAHLRFLWQLKGLSSLSYLGLYREERHLPRARVAPSTPSEAGGHFRVALHRPCVVFAESGASSVDLPHMRGLLLSFGEVTCSREGGSAKGATEAVATSAAVDGITEPSETFEVVLPAISVCDLVQRDDVYIPQFEVRFQKARSVHVEAQHRTDLRVGNLSIRVRLRLYERLLRHLVGFAAPTNLNPVASTNATGVAAQNVLEGRGWLFGVDGFSLPDQGVVVAPDADHSNDVPVSHDTAVTVHLGGVQLRVSDESAAVHLVVGPLDVRYATAAHHVLVSDGSPASDYERNTAFDAPRLVHGADGAVTAVNETSALHCRVPFVELGVQGRPPLFHLRPMKEAHPLDEDGDGVPAVRVERKNQEETVHVTLGESAIRLDSDTTMIAVALLYVPYAKRILPTYVAEETVEVDQDMTLREPLRLSRRRRLHVSAARFNSITIDANGQTVEIADCGNEAVILLDEGLILNIVGAKIMLPKASLDYYVKAGNGSYVIADESRNVFRRAAGTAETSTSSLLSPLQQQQQRPGRSSWGSATWRAATAAAVSAASALPARFFRRVIGTGRLLVVLPEPPKGRARETSLWAQDAATTRSLVLEAQMSVCLVDIRQPQMQGQLSQHEQTATFDLSDFGVRCDCTDSTGNLVVERTDLVTQWALKVLHQRTESSLVSQAPAKGIDRRSTEVERNIKIQANKGADVRLRYSDVVLCTSAVQYAQESFVRVVGNIDVSAFTQWFSQRGAASLTDPARWRKQMDQAAAGRRVTGTHEAAATTAGAAPQALGKEQHLLSNMLSGTSEEEALSSVTFVTFSVQYISFFAINDSAMVDVPLFHFRLDDVHTPVGEQRVKEKTSKWHIVLHVTAEYYDLSLSVWRGLLERTAMDIVWKRRANQTVEDVQQRRGFCRVGVHVREMRLLPSPVFLENVRSLIQLREQFQREQQLRALEAAAPVSPTELLAASATSEFFMFKILQNIGMSVEVSFAQDAQHRFPHSRRLRHGDTFPFNFPRIDGHELSRSQQCVMVNVPGGPVQLLPLASYGVSHVPLGPGLLARHVLVDIAVERGQKKVNLRTNVKLVNELPFTLQFQCGAPLDIRPQETGYVPIDGLRKRVELLPRVPGRTCAPCAMGMCYDGLPCLAKQTYLCVAPLVQDDSPQSVAELQRAGTVVARGNQFEIREGMQSSVYFLLRCLPVKSIPTVPGSAPVKDCTVVFEPPLFFTNRTGVPIHVTFATRKMTVSRRGGLRPTTTEYIAFETLASVNINAGETHSVTEADPFRDLCVDISLNQPNGSFLGRAMEPPQPQHVTPAWIYCPHDATRCHQWLVLRDMRGGTLMLLFHYAKNEVTVWCPYWFVNQTPFFLQLSDSTARANDAKTPLIAGLPQGLEGGVNPSNEPFLYHSEYAHEMRENVRLFARLGRLQPARSSSTSLSPSPNASRQSSRHGVVWSKWSEGINIYSIVDAGTLLCQSSTDPSQSVTVSYTVALGAGPTGTNETRVITFRPRWLLINRTSRALDVRQCTRSDIRFAGDTAKEDTSRQARTVLEIPAGGSATLDTVERAATDSLLQVRLRENALLTEENGCLPVRQPSWSNVFRIDVLAEYYFNARYEGMVKYDDYAQRWRRHSPAAAQALLDSGASPSSPPRARDNVVDVDGTKYLQRTEADVLHLLCYRRMSTMCVVIEQPRCPPYIIENRTSFSVAVRQRSTRTVTTVYPHTSQRYTWEETSALPVMALWAFDPMQQVNSRFVEINFDPQYVAKTQDQFQQELYSPGIGTLFVRVRGRHGQSYVISVTPEVIIDVYRSLPFPQLYFQLEMDSIYALFKDANHRDYALLTIKPVQFAYSQGVAPERAQGGDDVLRIDFHLATVQLDDERPAAQQRVVAQLVDSSPTFFRLERRLSRWSPVLFFPTVVAALAPVEVHLEDSFMYDSMNYLKVLRGAWDVDAVAKAGQTGAAAAAAAAPGKAPGPASVQLDWQVWVQEELGTDLGQVGFQQRRRRGELGSRTAVITHLELAKVMVSISLYRSPGADNDPMWESLGVLSLLVRSVQDARLQWPTVDQQNVCDSLWMLIEYYTAYYRYRFQDQIPNLVHVAGLDFMRGFVSDLLQGYLTAPKDRQPPPRRKPRVSRRAEANFPVEHVDERGGLEANTSNNNATCGSTETVGRVALSGAVISRTATSPLSSGPVRLPVVPRTVSVDGVTLSIQQVAVSRPWSVFVRVATGEEIAFYGAAALFRALRTTPTIPTYDCHRDTSGADVVIASVAQKESSSGNRNAAVPESANPLMCTRCAELEAIRDSRATALERTPLPHPRTGEISWAELLHHVSFSEFVLMCTPEEVKQFAPALLIAAVGTPYNVIRMVS